MKTGVLADYLSAIRETISLRIRRADPLPIACVVAAGIIGVFLVYTMVAFYDRDPVVPANAAPERSSEERLRTGETDDVSASTGGAGAHGGDDRGAGSSRSADRGSTSSTAAGGTGTAGSGSTGTSGTSRSSTTSRSGSTTTTGGGGTSTTAPGSSSTTAPTTPTTDPPPTSAPTTILPPITLPDLGGVLKGVVGGVVGLL